VLRIDCRLIVRGAYDGAIYLLYIYCLEIMNEGCSQSSSGIGIIGVGVPIELGCLASTDVQYRPFSLTCSSSSGIPENNMHWTTRL